MRAANCNCLFNLMSNRAGSQESLNSHPIRCRSNAPRTIEQTIGTNQEQKELKDCSNCLSRPSVTHHSETPPGWVFIVVVVLERALFQTSMQETGQLFPGGWPRQIICRLVVFPPS